MNKPLKIPCPICGAYVGTYDGRASTNPICRCTACGKRVLYRVDTGEIEILPEPKRVCSSGLTFS